MWKRPLEILRSSFTSVFQKCPLKSQPGITPTNYDTNHATNTQYCAKHRHGYENGPECLHRLIGESRYPQYGAELGTPDM